MIWGQKRWWEKTRKVVQGQKKWKESVPAAATSHSWEMLVLVLAYYILHISITSPGGGGGGGGGGGQEHIKKIIKK